MHRFSQIGSSGIIVYLYDLYEYTDCVIDTHSTRPILETAYGDDDRYSRIHRFK